MCSILPANAQCYSERVKPEQEIIAQWILRTQVAHGLPSLGAWAKLVKDKGLGSVSATTLTRAVDPKWESVSSVETLHILARSVGEPSVLDFLAGRNGAVSAEQMRPILAAALKHAPKGRWSDRDVERLAAAIEYGLGLAVVDPATQTTEDALTVAARAAAARFREGAVGS